MSGFAGGQPSALAEELLTPIGVKGAETVGFISSLFLGAAQAGKAVTGKALAGLEKVGLGTKSIKALSQAAGTATTLATKTAADLAIGAINGEEVTALDASKQILGAAGFGAVLGGVGGLSQAPSLKYRQKPQSGLQQPNFQVVVMKMPYLQLLPLLLLVPWEPKTYQQQKKNLLSGE